MSEKLYIRKCERYTVWEATEPIEVDVEKLRQCEPPYEGETPEDLLHYFEENVWETEEFSENETNKEILGEDLVYEYVWMDGEMTEYSNTAEKYGQFWLDVGVPNDEWRKHGNFETFATSVDRA